MRHRMSTCRARFHHPMHRLTKAALPLVALSLPCLAHADAGVPMLALAWPVQWLALIPIVLLECEISRRQLQFSFRRMFWPIAKANLISTLVGVPVAWLVMLLPLMVVGLGYSMLPAGTNIPSSVELLVFPFTAAWVGGSSPWEVYVALVILTVPFCAISIFLEEGVLRKSFPDQDHSVIRSVTVRANVWSYVLLSAFALAFPLTA